MNQPCFTKEFYILFKFLTVNVDYFLLFEVGYEA